MIPGSRVEEGLRFSAAMLGMDHPMTMVFVDNGVEILLPEALYKNSLKDYLRAVSDLSGVYVLRESLEKKGLTKNDLEPSINAILIDFGELAQMIRKCSVVTSF